MAAAPTPGKLQGGAMLLWRSAMWHLVSVQYHPHRVVVAVLQHVDGTRVRVAAVHMHHDAPERVRLWERLESLV